MISAKHLRGQAMKTVWTLLTLVFLLIAYPVMAIEPKPDLAKAGMAEAHNAVRSQTDKSIPAMTYSDTVATTAQAWANKLAADGCQLIHNPDRLGYGENIFWHGALKGWTASKKDANGNWIKDWYTKVVDIKAADAVDSWASGASVLGGTG